MAEIPESTCSRYVSCKRKAPPDHTGSAVPTPHASDSVRGDEAIVDGYRVHAEVARRSGLLSGLSDTAGRASLPAGITPEHLQLWQTACMLDTQPTTE